MTHNFPDSGIILVYKDPGITSYDVIRILKKRLNIKKIGHSGTLDPFAEGLLIILTGTMTRLFDLFKTLKKTYRARAVFGWKTDTLDSTGKVTAEAALPSDLSVIKKAADSFCGLIEQTPPVFSSVHINGVRAYKLARQGIKPDIPSKKVQIDSIKINSYEYNTLDFTVTCSSGTYIRTLAADIAEKCNSAAYLDKLERISVGDFTADNAKSAEKITESDIIKPYETFKKLHIPCLFVKEKHITDILNGKTIQPYYFTVDPVISYAGVFSENHDFLAFIDNRKSDLQYIFVVPEKNCLK